MPVGRRRSGPFVRSGSGVTVRLAAENRAELHQVCEFVLQLVDAPADPLFPPAETPAEPADPAMARLFPAAYDDGAAAGEFRRLSEGDLRSGKRRDAERLQATAAEREISTEDAEAWLRAINDVRLVLAVRLGIEHDDDTERLVEEVLPDPATDRATAALIATFLRMGVISELLIEALDG